MMISSSPVARPHIIEESVKPAIETTKMRLRPNRVLSQPEAAVITAVPMMKEVTSQAS